MYVIQWCGHYISKKGMLSKYPYTSKLEEAKRWTTFNRAKRYLNLKDDGWASGCTIITLEEK